MVRSAQPAIVTLTTDFGTEDAYVAQIKGVLSSEGPHDLRIVDLSHALPAQDLAAACLFLEAAVPRFPSGTIHVAVIDPGVGSPRKALIVQYRGQLIVAPDNGIASAALQDGGVALQIDVPSLGLAPLSNTFHGRDLFAPVAARLARGLQAIQLASPLNDPVTLPFPTPIHDGDVIEGQVIHVDHFGNLISNIRHSDLPQQLAQPAQVQCGAHTMPLASHYADVAVGEALALFGSQGRLEIAVRNGHAQRELGAGRKSRIQVLLR